MASMALTACDDLWIFPNSYESIDVKNESSDTMCIYAATGSLAYGPTAYPDTLLPKDFLLTREAGFPDIDLSVYLSIRPYPPRQWKPLIIERFNRKAWKKSMAPCVLPRDTLSVFFICKDTLNKYGYDDVQENNRVQLRIDYSKDDLREVRNDIIYPPRASMSHMHMNPSYDKFYQWYNNR